MATLREDLKAERKKMKDRPFSEKLAYYWEYYRVHAIVAIVVVLVIVAVIRTITSYRNYALYIAAVNSEDFTGEASDVWVDDMTEILKLDTKKDIVFVDTTIQVGSGQSTSQNEYAAAQKLTALLTSRSIDIMISDLPIFEQYAQNRCFVDLRTLYSEEELASMSGMIYYTDASTYSDYETNELNVRETQAAYVVDHHDPSSMKDPVPVGFFAGEGTAVAASGIYAYLEDEEEYQGHPDEAVFGIMANAPEMDSAIAVIPYLLGR